MAYMCVARVVPVKDSKRKAGSRAGYLIYQNLINNPGEYPWATSHTVQSWNNHYKKNAGYYDRQIERYLEKHPEIGRDNEAQAFRDLEFDEDSPPVSPRRPQLPRHLSSRSYSPPDLPESSHTGANRVVSDDDDEPGDASHQQHSRTTATIPHRTQNRADARYSPIQQEYENTGPSRRLATNQIRARAAHNEALGSQDDTQDSNPNESEFGDIRDGDPKDQADWAKLRRKRSENTDNSEEVGSDDSQQEAEEIEAQL